jgi:hypothetical protein
LRLLTRTGLDWTHKYSPIAADVAVRSGNISGTPLPAMPGCASITYC